MRRVTRCTPARSRLTLKGWDCCVWLRRSTATGSGPATSPKSGVRDASSGPPCSATSWRAFTRDPALVNLLLDDSFRDAIESRQGAWRFVVQTAVGIGIPVPATGASLAYFDAYRSERLPANLTQAQRDYFGAHTYRRIDKPGVFHTEW